MEPFCLIIDGGRVRTEEHFEVLNPAKEKPAGLAPLGQKKDLDDAVAAAERAFKKWREAPEADRQAACMAVASKVEENAEELAHLLTAEQGKPLNGLGSRWEIGGAVAWARYTASLSLPVKVLQDNEQGRVELHRKPVGVVGSITPWNFPVMIAIWHTIPAILAGNTVVCKPSPFTPLSTLRLVELMDDVHDEVCGELVAIAEKMKMGEGTSEDVVLGPVQNEKQYDIVADLTASAKSGGVKRSGVGVEFGEEGLLEYTDIQVVFS